MIKISSLHKRFKNSQVLKGVNLNIEKSSIHVIYGKNGAGKSTLLNCVCGLIKQDLGKIEFQNIDKNRLGIVLGNHMLINKLTAKEYLRLVCELKKIDKDLYVKKIDYFFKKLAFGDECNTLIEDLSKGTKAKLNLTASVIHQPELLVLDEPFAGLDLNSLDQTLDIIKEQSNNGCTVILSTHRTDFLSSIMDKLSILKDGKIDRTYDSTFFAGMQEDSISDFLKKQI
ncbi:ABC transporter ATP-binding protein [Aquimarina brevivitae]|uniref:ABC-2 type transport system ATP-binding protein n=1 Tax=Aquimarina brevivitae TaxID=323412 RepID=A0A4V2F7A6_9FLAO|nr:ABC transporter ATP-binding protein [Aquimarina brevivitae]RZS99149.1 ABC-2 type transport system ATP-binding protein [Aquimarina brevivitae]